MKFETERLIIRPIRNEDKIDLFEYRSDPVANKYQGWIPKHLIDAELFIENVSKQINITGTWFQWVIIEKMTQKIIGDMGVHFLDPNGQQVELGITLNKDFQNKGYATESVKRVIDYLFNDLKKHRIITSIDPENTSSVRLVERMGFRKEAHFMKSLLINGKWVDDVIYAMIEEDWSNH
jgi:RimJ/RimL family protein N-acetyltransferase